MDLERLILLVQEHEFLYNYKDKSYHDTEKKEMVWRIIGEELNQSGKECKKQWALLRDAYRRNLKKRKRVSGEKAVQAKRMKWKYEDEIGFLQPYLKEREARPSYNMSNSSSGEVEPASYENNTTSQENELTDDENTKNKKQDKIEALFYSLAQTVKKMDPYYRSLAKAKVCSIVSDLEIQNLTHQSGAPHTSISISNPSPTSPSSCASNSSTKVSTLTPASSSYTPTPASSSYTPTLANHDFDINLLL